MRLLDQLEGFKTGGVASFETGNEAYANDYIFIRVTRGKRQRSDFVITCDPS